MKCAEKQALQRWQRLDSRMTTIHDRDDFTPAYSSLLRSNERSIN
jgi:hypothetical protein